MKNMKKQRQVRLTPYGRIEFERFCNTSLHNSRLVKRAKIILALDTSENRAAERQGSIAKRLGVSRQTIYNAKRDFLAMKSLSFLERKKRNSPPVHPKVTSELENNIIYLVRNRKPINNNRWTLRLLAEVCVKLGYIDNISHMTINRILRKHGFITDYYNLLTLPHFLWLPHSRHYAK